ncbi:hypothetical protein [Actinomycetospora termitidis]|uniref:Minor tail protein n=1 Tax=Actinomycetospora termitidis TaxID=3053470 RepID=A0ABT7MFE1_9PSEU|nr:hypothetical protein [Actinomycetospora sp. Odt1-22]MDL5159385.1 hypothetical protein [Actinomycetospora sp. Odt1-22]
MAPRRWSKHGPAAVPAAQRPRLQGQEDDILSAAFPWPDVAAANYVFLNSPSSSATAQTTTGTLRVTPWVVRKTLSLARIGAEVTAAGEAGSKYRIAIYGDDGGSRPGALVLDAGQIAGDSVAVQELTIALTLPPGVYWVGGATQTVTTTQPTMRTVAGWFPPLPIALGAAPGSGANILGYAMTGVTGAAPATFNTSGGGTAIAPRIHARAA